MDIQKTGIIVQARMGSTRFPEKMMVPFYGDQRLIDVILDRIIHSNSNFPLILATTNNPIDDPLVDHVKQKKVEVYRGSEGNVLQRFISAASKYNLSTIFRVCADNPFFDIQGTLKLLNFHLQSSADYTGYRMKDGSPTITNHLGFWGEVVELNALKEVAEKTEDQFYSEHVTNYLYNHSDEFNISLVDAPAKIGNRYDIRLTLDTHEDYEIQSALYAGLMKDNISVTPANIIEWLDQHPDFIRKMQQQINTNQK
ncbi:MAG: cytidylyltransferase domain-containing protein [Bacteroidales bacterium]